MPWWGSLDSWSLGRMVWPKSLLCGAFPRLAGGGAERRVCSAAAGLGAEWLAGVVVSGLVIWPTRRLGCGRRGCSGWRRSTRAWATSRRWRWRWCLSRARGLALAWGWTWRRRKRPRSLGARPGLPQTRRTAWRDGGAWAVGVAGRCVPRERRRRRGPLLPVRGTDRVTRRRAVVRRVVRSGWGLRDRRGWTSSRCSRGSRHPGRWSSRWPFALVGVAGDDDTPAWESVDEGALREAPVCARGRPVHGVRRRC